VGIVWLHKKLFRQTQYCVRVKSQYAIFLVVEKVINTDVQKNDKVQFWTAIILFYGVACLHIYVHIVCVGLLLFLARAFLLLLVVAEPRSDSCATEAYLPDPDGPRHNAVTVRRNHRETGHHQQIADCCECITTGHFDAFVSVRTRK